MKISVKGLVLLGILLSAAGISPVFAQMANSAGSNPIVSTITVGNGSSSIAYDSTAGEMFVVNRPAGTVSVISDSSNAVIGTPIPVGANPSGIAYDSAKGEMFVTNKLNNTVSVISDSSNAVVGMPITVGNGPTSIAYDSAKIEMFVVNKQDNTVSVISDSSNAVIGTPIPVGANPSGIAYDSAKGEMFVTNKLNNTVSVISDSSNSIVATITVGNAPSSIVYDSAKGEMFVVNSLDDTVSVISDSSNAVIATITVGTGPSGIAYDSGQNEVFVVNTLDDTVSVISDSSNAVVGMPITVGNGPTSIAYDSAKSEIFVVNRLDGTVSVLSDSPTNSMPTNSQMNIGSNSSTNMSSNLYQGTNTPSHPIYNYTISTNLPPPSYLITNESGSSSTITSVGLSPSVISITTNQPSYNDGDKIVISGSTKDYLGDTPLTLILRNPVGNVVTISQIPIGSNKTFSTDLTAGGALWQAAGAYSIYAQYGGPDRSTTTTFQFSGSHVSPGNTIPVDGTNMSVTYSITNGKVLDIKADTNSKSLIVSIQTNGDGTLTLNMPRTLIDAKKTDGSDDQFFVLNDGQENDQFQETSNTATARTLQIPFMDGTSQIEIIGTVVVPEFGPIAAMVLAIAIISIIVISTKTGLRFTHKV